MWQKASKETYIIDYVDSLMPSSRYYGHPGRLIINDGDASYEPDSRQLAGIKCFSAIFIPLFCFVAYFFIPGNQKWLFVFAGPTIGAFTFSMIYYLVKNDIDAGPYIQFISKSDEVILPRLDKRFARKSVTPQWITGRRENANDIQTDLNLIADGEDGNKRRYFVMGGPYRRYVKQFSEHARLPVVEVNLGWEGRRDADRTTQGPRKI